MELKNGVTNTDQALESQFQFNTSNDGYLGDVITLAGYHILSQEQKLPSCSKDQKVDQFPGFSTTAQPLDDCSFTQQKEFLATNISSLPPQGDTHKATIKDDPVPSNRASKEGQGKKIAYPFKWLKSRGVEGETTLNDINNQILTTPSKSKQIPRRVKDYETHPYKLARGLTGKAVTSLTRIHTRGKGSITIIRTKD